MSRPPSQQAVLVIAPNAFLHQPKRRVRVPSVRGVAQNAVTSTDNEAHNKVERRRKDRIRKSVQELSDAVIPPCPCGKMTTAEVLQVVVDRITELQRENEELRDKITQLSHPESGEETQLQNRVAKLLVEHILLRSKLLEHTNHNSDGSATPTTNADLSSGGGGSITPTTSTEVGSGDATPTTSSVSGSVTPTSSISSATPTSSIVNITSEIRNKENWWAGGEKEGETSSELPSVVFPVNNERGMFRARSEASADRQPPWPVTSLISFSDGSSTSKNGNYSTQTDVPRRNERLHSCDPVNSNQCIGTEADPGLYVAGSASSCPRPLDTSSSCQVLQPPPASSHTTATLNLPHSSPCSRSLLVFPQSPHSCPAPSFVNASWSTAQPPPQAPGIVQPWVDVHSGSKRLRHQPTSVHSPHLQVQPDTQRDSPQTTCPPLSSTSRISPRGNTRVRFHPYNSPPVTNWPVTGRPNSQPPIRSSFNRNYQLPTHLRVPPSDLLMAVPSPHHDHPNPYTSHAPDPQYCSGVYQPPPPPYSEHGFSNPSSSSLPGGSPQHPPYPPLNQTVWRPYSERPRCSGFCLSDIISLPSSTNTVESPELAPPPQTTTSGRLPSFLVNHLLNDTI